MSKSRIKIGCCVILLGTSTLGWAQQREKDVPLMRPDERETVNNQSDEFNRALEDVIRDAAASTVRIWGSGGRRGGGFLAYGTVVGDGTQVLTKWSEVSRWADNLQVQPDGRTGFAATVEGVYTDEDLVLLKLGKGGRVNEVGKTERVSPKLVPAKFFPSDLPLGKFITAPQPSGKPGAFGVVSVLERNLRETDQAHLGVMADGKYSGEGVRIASVQPEFGAAEAGLREGDVILEVDKRRISGLLELKNALSSKHPGDKVTILIDSAGKERSVEVTLSNRPVFGQFSGGRLNQMEIMGGPVSRVRSGFSRVVQSDMQIQKDQIGGPVVDLEGRIVGITIARADRTRTYVMGSEAVMDLLKTDYDTLEEAVAKLEEKQQLLAKQQRLMMPKMAPHGKKPKNLDDMKHHLDDTERLLGRLDSELEELAEP